jgi:hypothetical protein
MRRLREEKNELVPGVQDDRRHLLRSHFIRPSLSQQKNYHYNTANKKSSAYSTNSTHKVFCHKTADPHKCNANDISLPSSFLPQGTKQLLNAKQNFKEKPKKHGMSHVHI